MRVGDTETPRRVGNMFTVAALEFRHEEDYEKIGGAHAELQPGGDHRPNHSRGVACLAPTKVLREAVMTITLPFKAQEMFVEECLPTVENLVFLLPIRIPNAG